MRDYKFRQKHQCTLCNHINFEIKELKIKDPDGMILVHGDWLYPKCSCTKAFIYDGYKPIGSSEQFIGLKDSNGFEIYEGDEVSYVQKKNGKIQFNENKAQYEVFWTFGDIDTLHRVWVETEIQVTNYVK